jgi:glycosyltransferase involved in cell wall biosynthesis
MARAVASHADVTLASPFPDPLETPGVRRAPLDRATLPELLAATDCVVVQGLLFERFPALVRARVPMVVDLYDPMILEGLHLFRDRPAARRQHSHERLLALTLLQLHRGDYFLVANRAQRDFYLGMLAAVNRVNPMWAEGGQDLRRLMGLVPAGLPSHAPPGARDRPALRGVLPGVTGESRVILWAGGLWDWTDPLTLIEAMPAVLEAVPGARLVLWGTRHPNPEVPPMRAPGEARARARALGLAPHVVQFIDWVPYDERGQWLAEADVGVSLTRPSLEGRFAHRSRILDYLWAGVPVVATRGDSLAARIRRERLGEVVPPRDSAAAARALARLLLDHEERAAIRARMAALRPAWTWERAVRPLVRFLECPVAGAPRSLAFLGPLADLLAADRPLVRPVVKTAVRVARDGVISTLLAASRRGARMLMARPGPDTVGAAGEDTSPR